MPLRAYRSLKPGRCPHCKDGFEHWQKNDVSELTECPSCGSPVEIVSASSIFTPSVVRKPGTVQSKDAGFTVYKKNNDGLYDKQ